jgi:hypothetical protein
MTGLIKWNFLQDNTSNPKFFGTITFLTSSGSAAFTSSFQVGAHSTVDWTTTSLLSATPAFATLDALVAAKGTTTVGISSGEVDAVPLPAALPLFLSGAGLVGAFGWRRKRKAAAAA